MANDNDNLDGDSLLVAAHGGDEIDQAAASKGGGDGSGGDDGSNDDDKGVDDGAGSPGSGGDDGAGGGDDGSGEDDGKGDAASAEVIESVKADLEEQFNSFDNADDKEAQDLKKDLLALFDTAVDFDQQGNAIDKDGEIVGTYEDLVNKIASEPEVKYDAAGNQLGEDGKIVKTKHDLDIEASEVNTIAQELGYEIIDGEGNVKLYPQGNDGIKQLVEDVANQKNVQDQKDFFNQNPVLREVSKHLLAGGDLSEFQKPVDYSGVDIKALSFENKRNYIKQSYLAEGLAEERANKIVEGLTKETLKDEEVQEALTVLETKDTERQDARQATLQAQADQRVKDNTAHWNNVKSIVTEGKLDDFNIPKKDRDGFFKYLAIPVKDGLSQDMIDKREMELPSTLKEAYFRYTGYDVSLAAREGANTSRVQSIRERLRKTSNQDRTHNPKRDKGKDGEIDYDAVYAEEQA